MSAPALRPDGQIPGMTPRGVRRFRSHDGRRGTSANPASQPQASRHEDLQAVQTESQCLEYGGHIASRF